MNRFTIGNCYMFGKSIHTEYSGTWDELIVHPEWQPFVDSHELTKLQIAYIRRGMTGLPFREEIPQGDLFPFGIHKGKPFDKVPEKYWDWCEKQPWLEKWPSVKLHSDKLKAAKSEGKLSNEEIANLLKMD